MEADLKTCIFLISNECLISFIIKNNNGKRYLKSKGTKADRYENLEKHLNQAAEQERWREK